MNVDRLLSAYYRLIKKHGVWSVQAKRFRNKWKHIVGFEDQRWLLDILIDSTQQPEWMWKLEDYRRKQEEK